MKSILFSLAFAGLSFAAPANEKCPVSGKAVDSSVTSTHKGKEVAFCCAKCKAKFDAEPAKFEGKIK